MRAGEIDHTLSTRARMLQRMQAPKNLERGSDRRSFGALSSRILEAHEGSNDLRGERRKSLEFDDVDKPRTVFYDASISIENSKSAEYKSIIFCFS